MPTISLSHDTAERWRAFQARQGLSSIDGIPGPQTVGAVEQLERELGDTQPTGARFRLGELDLRRISDLHCDLQAVVHMAISLSTVDLNVTQTGGRRTLAEQKRLVAAGASRTLNSRHLTGHAVDTAPIRDGKLAKGVQPALALHRAFAEASARLQVPLRWGGDWDGDGDWEDEKFLDMWHHELPRAVYGVSLESRSSAAAEFLAQVRSGSV